MFSLAVIDKLTTGDLAGSKFVAGTGTIKPDGEVGQIGGITHKMSAARDAGATVFLVPAEELLRGELRTSCPACSWSRSTTSAGQWTRCTRSPPGGQPPSC